MTEDTKKLIAEALRKDLEKIFKQHIEDLKSMPVIDKWEE